MMWLTENISTILVGVALAVVVAGIVVSMLRNKKRGKSSCGCGCTDCAMKNACHSGKTK